MVDEQDIFNVFNRHGLTFVVVGGHAVILHGYGRLTEDTDIVWLRTPESEKLLLLALTELDAHYIGNEIDPATKLERAYPVNLSFIQANHLMMLSTRGGFLDLFDYVPGLPQENVHKLMDSSIEFHGVRVISRDWLRRLKKIAGRPKDLLDLENLPD